MMEQVKAVAIANDVEAIVRGEERVVVVLALAMVLGEGEAGTERPDIDGFLDVFGKAVRSVFDRRMAATGRRQ